MTLQFIVTTKYVGAVTFTCGENILVIVTYQLPVNEIIIRASIKTFFNGTICLKSSDIFSFAIRTENL